MDTTVVATNKHCDTMSGRATPTRDSTTTLLSHPASKDREKAAHGHAISHTRSPASD